VNKDNAPVAPEIFQPAFVVTLVVPAEHRSALLEHAAAAGQTVQAFALQALLHALTQEPETQGAEGQGPETQEAEGQGPETQEPAPKPPAAKKARS